MYDAHHSHACHDTGFVVVVCAQLAWREKLCLPDTVVFAFHVAEPVDRIILQTDRQTNRQVDLPTDLLRLNAHMSKNGQRGSQEPLGMHFVCVGAERA